MASVNIRIKKLYEDAIVPTQGSSYAAGGDLYAYIPGDKLIGIQPGETVMIGTGIAAAIPKMYWGGVFARSGLASKNGLAPANKVGVIDPDYRGEIKVALHNHSDEYQNVLQQVMGHSKITTTLDIYTSVTQEHKTIAFEGIEGKIRIV